MKRRFRLPYTKEQVYSMLLAGCKAEVKMREREFYPTQSFCRNVDQVAECLTSDCSKFGLFLCGYAGTGKTTIIKAMQSLIEYMRYDEPSGKSSKHFETGFSFVTAKNLLRLSKQFNNPTKDNVEDVADYRRILRREILAIDDMGEEAAESMSYGEIITTVSDVISYRYEHRLFTAITSNLQPSEVEARYGGRISDRFREMMQIITFNEQSFRAL